MKDWKDVLWEIVKDNPDNLCIMKKHVKIYLDYFGYDNADFIACEVCNSKAVDINHIQPRGMGGSKKKDNIENLIALCRSCHIRADFGSGETKLSKEYLKNIHLKNIY